MGLLVEKELNFLSRLTKNPERPFAAILGGAKVSDKLGVLLRLVETIDVLIIGGGMAYTFLAAQGVSIGKSLLEKDSIPEAKKVLDLAARRGVKCLLPVDHVAVPEIKADAKTLVTPSAAVPDGLIGVDIGPRSAAAFAGAVAGAKTVFWNGPMGIFEMEPFFAGSLAVAQAMADATAKGAVTIVGGGDSLAVLAKAGLAGKMSHCSTGGGASLEFIEGRELPGLAALDAKPESGIIRA